jgi:hypothetical protein
MLFSGRSSIVVLSISLGIASAAKAGLEKELGEVDTSVGLTKANAVTATQKWELTTDPQDSTMDIGPLDSLDMYPLIGSLNNSWDPTKFNLATDTNPNAVNQYPTENPLFFALGYTVMGVGPFEVTSFTVDMTGDDPGDGGGSITVSENDSNPGVDNITDTGDYLGTPTGVITDVVYQVIPSDRDEELTVANDQDFYQINLFEIGNDPNFDPGVGTADVGPDSYLTVTDFDGNTQTIPSADIMPSVTPEPASAALLGMAAIGLLARRRPRIR